MVEARAEGELAELVRSAYEPLLVLAGGSNVVVADGGFPGTVVRVLTRGVRREGERLEVQAGEPWDELVARCVAAGLQGFECLSGIPGSTGATPIQNVGAYGQEVSETVESVRVLDRASGQISELTAAAVRLPLPRQHLQAPRPPRRARRHLPPARVARLRPAALRGAGARARRAGRRQRAAGGRPRGRAALRRGKGMVIDPADPDSVSAGSFFTNPISRPTRSRACRTAPGSSTRRRSPSRTAASRPRRPG